MPTWAAISAERPHIWSPQKHRSGGVSRCPEATTPVAEILPNPQWLECGGCSRHSHHPGHDPAVETKLAGLSGASLVSGRVRLQAAVLTHGA